MATERVPFTVDDLYQIGWLEDPRLSPDGKYVAYVHVNVDRLRNGYRRAIWVAPTDGGPPRRFTSGAKSDTAPRWSHDGQRLAFVSTRDDAKGQIYVIAVDGGEAQQLTRLPNGASNPAWSYDNSRIACLSQANETERVAEDRGEQPAPPESDWEARLRKEQREHEDTERNDPRVITKLPYRTGTSFFDDRRAHIYVVDVPAGDITDPSAGRRITDGDLHHSAPTWMPDSESLLTTATRDPEADSLFAFYDVLRVPATGGQPESLTMAGYSYFDPRPSPDGTQIAFTRKPEDRLLASGARIAVIPAGGGMPRDLTELTDLNVESFSWQPDSQGLLFNAGWGGDTAIYRVGLGQSQQLRHGTEVVGTGHMITEFDVSKDGGVAFVLGSATNPCDLFYRSSDGELRQLTHINSELLEARQIAPIEEVRYVSADGGEVQGWVLRPADFDPSQSYPLAVFIHGGPHLMWGPGTRSMWHEWQVAVARGYVVFFCNPRGSDGYGELWRDAIHGSWGTADSPDIHAGIDTLVQAGGIDTNRIAVTGGSYGGYMTTWLIGNSDRFCCAVAARGVYNLLTEHSTSDAHELIEIEFDGYPWDLYEELWHHSPLAHAHKIETPLLLLHSELDYRVPISEAEQLFAFLRRRKRIVELIRYPREGHELTRSGEPRHRADHMQRTLDWFDRYCKRETS